MEQDGNTAMPKSPDFSSPNNPVNTSSAVDQSNSQDIAAAAAALPENDRPAITSAPGATNSHMFGRHFKPQASKAQQAAAPVSPTFAGAPDFFNEAAAKNSDYITIGQDDAKRSNKKRFIIIGALVALIAVVGVVALVAPGVVNNIQVANSNKNLIPSFNKFAHYLIDGSESTENISGDIEINDYTAHKIDYMSDSENEEQKKQYFEKLLSYYDDFKNNAKNIDKEKYDEDVFSDEAMNRIYEVITFVRDIDELDDNTDIDLSSYYRSNGLEKAEQYIADSFSEYIDSENSITQNYFSAKQEIYNNYIALIKEIGGENLCMPNENESEGNLFTCLETKDSALFAQTREKNSTIKESLSSYKYNMSNLAISDTVNMSNQLHGDNNE